MPFNEDINRNAPQYDDTRIFAVVFLNPSSQILGYFIKIGHGRVLASPGFRPGDQLS